MIENYLDFVKAERKRLLKASKADFREVKRFTCEWLQGYYRGKATGELCASWRWKQFQKDIEAQEAKGYCLTWQPTIAKSLQDQFEEVERRNVQSKKG